jgi:hypothetical protein
MITWRAPWRRSLNQREGVGGQLLLARTPKVPEPERTLPEATQGDDRAVLQVVLVDAEKGIVRGVRSLTLSPEFTRALQGAIRPRRRQPGPRRCLQLCASGHLPPVSEYWRAVGAGGDVDKGGA